MVLGDSKTNGCSSGDSLNSDVNSFKIRFKRILWRIVWVTLFLPSPKRLHFWRRLLLRIFGAQIGKHVRVFPNCRIWAPWNLTMKDNSSLQSNTDCYCVDKVTIGRQSHISQYSYLCTTSHDYEKVDMPLVSSPIVIEDYVWICADAFVGRGITIGEGVVVGARASVFKDVEPWTVVGGTPAKFIKKRILKDGDRLISS